MNPSQVIETHEGSVNLKVNTEPSHEGTLYNHKFGLIELHSEIAGTMFNVTNSSRILHK